MSQLACEYVLSIVCSYFASKFLYPLCGDDVPVRQRAGQYELFTKVDSMVRKGLSELILSDNVDHTSSKSDSLLGGAMARALCYIQRFIILQIGILIPVFIVSAP